MSSLCVRDLAADACKSAAPRMSEQSDIAAQSVVALPQVWDAMLPQLECFEQLRALTVNRESLAAQIPVMYKVIDADAYGHLLLQDVPKDRLRRYFSHVQHMHLSGGFAFAVLAAAGSAFALFDRFAQLRKLTWEGGRITKHTAAIASRCLDSHYTTPGAILWDRSADTPIQPPTHSTCYTVTRELDVFVGRFWDRELMAQENPTIPQAWTHMHYPVPVDDEPLETTYRQELELSLLCSWSDPCDNNEATWIHFARCLVQVLVGPVRVLNIDRPSTSMLDHIALVLQAVQADKSARLPLDSVNIIFDQWHSMSNACSVRALEAIRESVPAVKVIITDDRHQGISRYEHLLSILPFANSITHLELIMPFDLFERPAVTIDTQNPRPIDDVTFPHFETGLSRQRMSSLSAIRQITFTAQARGGSFEAKMQAALAIRRSKEEQWTAPRPEGEGIMLLSNYWDEEDDDVDPRDGMSQEELDEFSRRIMMTCDNDIDARVASSSKDALIANRSRANSNASGRKWEDEPSPSSPVFGTYSSNEACSAIPARSERSHSISSSAFPIACFSEPVTPQIQEDPAEVEAREIELSNWHLTMLGSVFAIIGAPDVQMRVKPFEHRVKTDNVHLDLDEFPLEHWFEDSAGKEAGEVAVEFVEGFVADAVKEVRPYYAAMPEA